MYVGEYRRWRRAKNRRRGLRIKTIEEDRERKAAQAKGARIPRTWDEVEKVIQENQQRSETA